jgi:hypothetical protein
VIADWRRYKGLKRECVGVRERVLGRAFESQRGEKQKRVVGVKVYPVL